MSKMILVLGLAVASVVWEMALEELDAAADLALETHDNLLAGLAQIGGGS